MNRSYLSLLAGALVFAAAALPQQAQAQTFCMTDNFGYLWDLTLDSATDIILGSVVTSTATRDAIATRGTTSREIRHHNFIASSQTDSFWFQYNGLVSGAGGGTFSFSGDWINSAGLSGTVTGTIVGGTCRVGQNHQVDPNGPDAR